MTIMHGLEIRTIAALAALVVAINVAAAPLPYRIAIPPVASGDSDNAPSFEEEYAQLAGMWIRERAPECQSLTLVSQRRCDAIMRALTAGGRKLPANLLAAFRRHQPVDAVIYYVLTPRRWVEITIHSDDGIATEQFDAGPFIDDLSFPSKALPAVIRKTVELVASRLPITTADRQRLVEQRVADPFQFLAIYRNRSLPDPAPKHGTLLPPTDSGIPQLRGLKQYWRMNSSNHELAVEVVRMARFPCLAVAEPVPGGFRTIPQWISANANAAWAVMLKSCFQELLGTGDEHVVYPLARVAPRLIERETLELAKPLFVDFSVDGTLDSGGGNLDDSLGEGLGGTAASVSGAPAEKVPRTRRIGAVRLLGFLDSSESLDVLKLALSDKDPAIRLAAAQGAGRGTLGAASGEPLLKPLLKDADPVIAFAAAAALRRMGIDVPSLAALARRAAPGDSDVAADAIVVFAELAVAEDRSLLAALADERPRECAALATALLRLKGADSRRIGAWLSDPDGTVIEAVLAADLDAGQIAANTGRLIELADDPYSPVAGKARLLLARKPPADQWEAMAREMRTGHPYVRECLLERIAMTNDARSAVFLATECGNNDAQVRVKALQLLGGIDPAAARARLAAALADPDPWVAFHAAAFAPRLASREIVPALKAALAAPVNSAAAVYLRQALAVAGGTPPPRQPAAARPLTGDRAYAWCTTPGLYAADSPFDAYYCMDTKRIDNLRAAHAAGKVLVARVHPLREPARLVLEPAVRAGVLAAIDREVNDEVASMLDGIVYGEETMSFPSDPLWPEAWTLFCRDASIDPVRIAGRIEALTAGERHAWLDWTRRINIRGFNMLYEYTKLRLGVLRPGIQIGTFEPAGVEMKFDFSGVYDYKGDNRLCAYDLVRGAKTIYPGKPVLWLSLGIGGYEMNPVRDSTVVPSGPIFETWGRAWSDSVTAWLAGAETGWFSVWLFVSPVKGRTDSGMESLRGKTVWVEDIGPKSPVLKTGIDWSFAYATEFKEQSPKPPKIDPLTDDSGTGEELLIDADRARADGQEALDTRVAASKEAMKNGFLYYQQHVYDCARIFASLPRQDYRAPALVQRDGVSVWTRPESGYPLIPAAALLNCYDYIQDINLTPRLDLDAYRLIVTHDPGLLRDPAMRSIKNWLTRRPGLLVVHRSIPAANDAEAGTVEDHDGRLVEDWPWEADVSIKVESNATAKTARPIPVTIAGRVTTLTNGCIGSVFELRGPNAVSLATVDGRTVLALWRNPEFKGAVLFDGMQYVSADYLELLRGVLNDLHRDRQVGMRVEGPALLETLDTPAIKAAAATRYYNDAKESVVLPGLDALSGRANPAVGRLIGSVSGLSLHTYTGRFVAASTMLTALSEKPFTTARVDGETLTLATEGIIRIGSMTGAVAVEPVVGGSLPDALPGGDDDFARWLFVSKDEGIHVAKDTSLVYVRSARPVVVRPIYPSAAKDREARDGAAEKGAAVTAVREMTIDLGGGAAMVFVRIDALDAWVGKYEVTNQEYQRFRPGHRSRHPKYDGERQPVVDVTHTDASAFANWLTGLRPSALPAGHVVRLPTGREWVVFAQCGDQRIYPWGNAWPPSYGNYHDSTGQGQESTGVRRDGYEASCPVDKSGRNDWGLYGVGGNVWEWTDELTARESGWRIRRGGFWGWELWGDKGYEQELRCTHRSYAFPDLRHHGTGFRVILAPARVSTAIPGA